MIKRIDSGSRRMRRKPNTIYITVCLVVVTTCWLFFVRIPTCRPQSTNIPLSPSRLSTRQAVRQELFQIPNWVVRYNVSHLFDWTWHKTGDFRRCQIPIIRLAQSYACRAESATVVNDALGYFRLHPDEGCIVDNVAGLSSPIPHPLPRARSLLDTCSSLHIDQKWIFCRKSQAELNSLVLTNRRFITTAVFDAFIDPGSCHPNVPGTVFTNRATFHLQQWTGNSCGNEAISIIPTIDDKYQYNELIDSIGNYLEAPGHFGPEQLPRLLRLLATVPATAKVLVAKGGIADAFIDILVDRGIVTRDRIVPFDKDAHVNYFANVVYRSESWPFLTGEDSSYYVYDRTDMELVHRALIDDKLAMAEKRDRIILIKRKDGAARSIIEHPAMATFMASALNQSNLSSKFHIEIFEAHGHLRDHIALFRQARVIVGPHGAGMMNILWSSPGTHVVEVGYDAEMPVPEMYALMSVHLQHHYWICKGHGRYSGPIHVNMNDFTDIFNQIIEELKIEDG